MKIHRNLLWLETDPELLTELLANPKLARLIVACPSPGLAAIRTGDQERLLKALASLGHVPKLEARR